MHKILITIICLLFGKLAFTQDTERIYLEGVDSMKTGNYDAAIKLFSQVTKIETDNPYAWYNKGIAESLLGLDEAAISDFEQAIHVNPNYKKAWLNLGTSKKHQTDYDGAFEAYRKALQLDPAYTEACFNLAVLYELFQKKDSACAFYQKALELGSSSAERKIKNCQEKSDKVLYPILRLSRNEVDESYGYSEQNPIKVGSGPDGGPANQHAYLNLLRDAQGRKVFYERMGSCCHYPSENGMFGMGMLDIYEISYYDKQGKKQVAKVYISFYDYEAPKLIKGFKTVGKQ